MATQSFITFEVTQKQQYSDTQKLERIYKARLKQKERAVEVGDFSVQVDRLDLMHYDVRAR